MVKPVASNVKLIPHRWAMHAMQALAHRDASLLTRVFTAIKNLPAAAIDTQIKTVGCGAPLQFHDFGFFDASASDHSPPLFDRVVDGDTLLLLALRRLDPACAAVLLDGHSSLDIANATGETPLAMLFDTFAAFQIYTLRQAKSTDPIPLENTPEGHIFAPLLKLQQSYESLFTRVRDRLEQHHEQIQAHVEAELHRIYALHAPERLAKIETQMGDFAYRELELLQGVKQKYEA